MNLNLTLDFPVNIAEVFRTAFLYRTTKMAVFVPTHYGEQKTNKGLNEKLINLEIILSLLFIAIYLLPDDSRLFKFDLGQTENNLTQPI